MSLGSTRGRELVAELNEVGFGPKEDGGREEKAKKFWEESGNQLFVEWRGFKGLAAVFLLLDLPQCCSGGLH
jgi:hypothetical protein